MSGEIRTSLKIVRPPRAAGIGAARAVAFGTRFAYIVSTLRAMIAQIGSAKAMAYLRTAHFRMGSNRARGYTALAASLLCILLAPSAWATRTVRVYEVDVAGQSLGSLQDAMRQALVRATGRRESASDSALTNVVNDAANYVKGYTKGPRGESQVVFDGIAVERAITAAGRSIWDPQRPFTLVVLYPPQNRAADDAARAQLEQTATERGLLISVIPLPIVDANGAELGRDALLQTAQRYGGDEVLVGRSDAGAANGQYQWTLHTNFSSQTWSGPLQAGIDGTVDMLAPVQGNGTSLAQTELNARVKIDGVTGLTDYATVQRALESISGVRKVNITEATANSVTFELTVRGGADAIDRVMGGSTHFARNTGAGGDRLAYEYHR